MSYCFRISFKGRHMIFLIGVGLVLLFFILVSIDYRKDFISGFGVWVIGALFSAGVLCVIYSLGSLAVRFLP